MKFCQRCGKEIREEAVICPNCGCVTGTQSVTRSTSSDTGSAGWLVLGLFFPLIGLILYLVWKDTRPNDANQAGKGALIGLILSVVFSIIYGVALGSLIGSSLY